MLTDDQILDIFIKNSQLEERDGVVFALVPKQAALLIAKQIQQSHHEFRPAPD